ncbi:MAG: phage tail tape measure protein [Bacteroides sp.]|uniref:phage tail tape measure protein n=1 Tax=Bacteroides sp. TaxID=29523 RepID=UPI002FC82057
MANETKISELVDKKALDDLSLLNLRINTIAESYKKTVAEIGSGISIKVNGIQDYSEKFQKLTTAIEKGIVADKALKDAKKEQEALLKRISDQTKENVKDALEKVKADKVAEQAALAAAKVETERLKQQRLMNQEKKQQRVTIEEAVVIMKQQIKTDREAIEQSRLLRAAKKDVDHTTEEGRKLIMQMNAVIDRNTETCRRNADTMVKQKMTIGDYKEQIKGALISLKNGEKGFKNIGIVAKGFGGILRESASPAIKEIKTGVSSMIKGWVGAQAVLTGIRKMIGLFESGYGSVVSFEAANSKLAAILGTTSDRTKDLTMDAKRLGDTTKYTASQATNLQIELAKLGFSRKEILDATEYILRFAQATGAELPEAAALAGAALRMFGAETTETERYVSAMAVATTKSALSFSYLQTAMPIVGPVAKAFNFQIEDTLALLGKLADAGFDASSAATATRNILLNLADGSGKLAKALGGPVESLPELVSGLQKLKDSGVDLNSTLELTDKRSVAAFNAFLTAADKIVPLREQITGVDAELKAMADTMGDNVEGATKGLSSAWEGFMITLGKNTGAIAGMIRELTDLVHWMRESVATAEELGEERLAAAKRSGEEASKQDKEWVKSKTESIFTVAKLLRNQGAEGTEAFEKAREQQLKVLERSLAQEEARLELYTKRNQKQWAEYNDRSFLKQGIGLQKATSAMNKDINESFALIEQQTGYIAGLKAKMEQVKGIANKYQIEEDGKNSQQILTDKEKAAAEKAAKERLKIEDNYRQSELALMDEGLEKELAKISAGYVKRMAEIRGQSKEEIATRKNLAEEMKREVDAKTESYNLDREKTDIANRVEAAKKGSEEELNLKLQQLELNREAEINEAEKTGQDVFAIDEKYKAKQMELINKYASERVKRMQNDAAVQSIILNQQLQGELDVLTNSYTTGIIDKEEFERRKSEIAAKYGIKQAETALELAKQQLSISGLSAEDQEDLAKKLAEAEIALSNAVRDVEIANAEKTADAHKRKMEKVANTIQMVGDLLNSFADLGSALFDRKINEIEGEQDANTEAGEAEIERIDKLEQSGAIKKEEAEARKRAAADRTAAKDAELAKKKAELQTKQAKMDKANAIVQTIIATALAVIKAMPNIPLSIIAGATGAASLAAIIAQPIPKYAKGTDNHPGGPAIVGDGGKHEAVVVGSSYFITPNTSTLLDLPRGAKVLPDIDKEMESLMGIAVKSDAMMAMYKPKPDKSNQVIVNNDYTDLKKEVQSTNRILSAMDKRGRRLNNRQVFNNYVNSKL